MAKTTGRTKPTTGLDEAAKILGISKEALRKRIKRGTIEASKDKSGHWQVFINEQARTNVQDKADETDGRGQDAVLDILRSENAFLRQELERKDKQLEQKDRQIESNDRKLERNDHLMMAQLQRLPRLEAPKKGFIEKLFAKRTSEEE